ncbi:MAG: Asp-tRNA(Asn)/Glu-tRNA(Gln) amidotransferase subunit GatC [Proteobacteria bacterium]|nr:Asp-tRNA(Asn)/Glu-tRNA(Gln) amidotransferase subunit GatC [Pseudomonadota bacterium]
MSRVTREEIEHIAALARLALAPEEIDRVTEDLDQVLEYVATLDGLDTEGIAPTAHAIPLATPLRDDVAATPLDPEAAVANAPGRAGTAFTVPKVIAGEEEG